MRSKSLTTSFAGWASGQPRRALLGLSAVVLVLGVVIYWGTYTAVAPHDRSETVWLLAFLAVLTVPVLSAAVGFLSGWRHGGTKSAVLFGAMAFALAALVVKLMWYALLIVVAVAWAGQ